MINITISAEAAKFESSVSGGIIDGGLLEPKWQEVDHDTFHLVTDQGVFLISMVTHTLNDNQYSTSSDAIVYLNSL